MTHRQDILTPKRIYRTDAGYQTVEDIAEKLRHKDDLYIDNRVFNIALTGPYGSGKSTVLTTLQQDHREYKYLQISLATLKANDENQKGLMTSVSKPEEPIIDKQELQKEKLKGEKQEADIDELNKKVEYSILQQIIYKENVGTLPNSRFRRILHINSNQLLLITVASALFFLLYALTFGQKWPFVDSFYERLQIGDSGRLIISAVGVLYISVCFAFLFKSIYRRLNSMQMSSFNLKDGSIELKGDESVFNKHMEEIVYFFQVTKYDVVIIEDLDRFGSTELFLKLRELNYLLNKSKIINRTIVFIYAIKDDLFENSSRTKFFDYIATVIPVINLSNSKDMLKKELIERGYDGFADDDLTTMSSFISDMRLLKNIANEYHQYYARLCKESESLDKTRLLGMIIYKNIHPKDFAELHIGKGRVYQCLSKKADFVAYIKDKVLKERRRKLQDLLDEKESQTHIKKKRELRELYMFHYCQHFEPGMTSIFIDRQEYSPKVIAGSEELFNAFRRLNDVRYRYTNYYNNNAIGDLKIYIQNWDNSVNSITYEERIKALHNDEEINKAQHLLLQEENKLWSLPLSALLKSYPEIRESDDFKNIGLSPIMEKFLLEGYIDEHYYGYISYFYPHMITNEEAQLVAAIQLGKPTDPLYPIINVKNVIDKIPLSDFRYDSVLNIKIMDYLIESKESYKPKLSASIEHITKKNGRIDFLAQYYQLGSHPDYLFREFIKSENSWEKCIHSGIDLRDTLIEGCLKFCGDDYVDNDVLKWMNGNYEYLSIHINDIGLEQTISLITHCKFENLVLGTDELLRYVIDHNLYALNTGNICLVVNYHCSDNIVPENVNLTKVIGSKSESLIKYVKDNISHCLENVFSQTVKDESEEVLLWIINNDNIISDIKKEYLWGQIFSITNILDVKEEFRELAVDINIVSPTWENVAKYSNLNFELPMELYTFIERNVGALSNDDYDVSANNYLPNELAYNNHISLYAYETVLPKIKEYITASDEEALTEDFEKERIEVLVNAGVLTYNENTRSIVAKCKLSVYAAYLLQHREFVSDISELKLSGEVMSILIDKSVLDKVSIVSSVTENQIADYPTLANQICHLLLSQEISLDMNVLVAIMTECTNLNDKIGVFNSTIRRHKENQSHSIVKELLSTLPKPYSLLREQPNSIDGNIKDESVLETLRICRFISTYNKQKSGIYRLYYQNGMRE